MLRIIDAVEDQIRPAQDSAYADGHLIPRRPDQRVVGEPGDTCMNAIELPFGGIDVMLGNCCPYTGDVGASGPRDLDRESHSDEEFSRSRASFLMESGS